MLRLHVSKGYLCFSVFVFCINMFIAMKKKNEMKKTSILGHLEEMTWVEAIPAFAILWGLATAGNFGHKYYMRAGT